MTNEQRDAVERLKAFIQTPVPEDSLDLYKWLALADGIIQEAQLAIDVEWAALREAAFAARDDYRQAPLPSTAKDLA